MGVVSESLTVDASPRRVWAAVVDFEARPRWSSRVKEATIDGGPPLRDGSRVRLRVDRDRFTYTVAEMRPPERLTLLVGGLLVRVHHVYELQDLGGSTRLTLSGRYEGLLGRLATRLMPKSLRRDLRDELAAVRRAVEPGR